MPYTMMQDDLTFSDLYIAILPSPLLSSLDVVLQRPQCCRRDAGSPCEI